MGLLSVEIKLIINYVPNNYEGKMKLNKKGLIHMYSIFICKSQKLAGYLMLFKNFRLIETQPSREDENRNVFLFTNSQILQDAINEYKEWRILNSNANFNNKQINTSTRTISTATNPSEKPNNE